MVPPPLFSSLQLLSVFVYLSLFNFQRCTLVKFPLSFFFVLGKGGVTPWTTRQFGKKTLPEVDLYHYELRSMWSTHFWQWRAMHFTPGPSAMPYLVHPKLLQLMVCSIWHHSLRIHSESHEYITFINCRWTSWAKCSFLWGTNETTKTQTIEFLSN